MFQRSRCYWAGAIVAVVLLAMYAHGDTTPATATSATVVANFNYSDCGSTVQVYSVNIEPCVPGTQEGSCQLYLGTSHVVTVVFSSGEGARIIYHDIQGKVWGVWMRFPKVNKKRIGRNACAMVDSGCPVPSNTNVTYSYPIEIASYYPQMSTTIQYSITVKDRGNEVPIVCFNVNTSIIRL